MKTVSVALILCLNVGVDPPDVVKTQPCARMECWIGNFLFSFASNSLESEYVICIILFDFLLAQLYSSTLIGSSTFINIFFNFEKCNL